MTRIVLQIHYIGTHFSGWQKQPNGIKTLQQVLEQAVSQIAGHQVEIEASGRTDRGVHALGQVVHFDTIANRSIYNWVRGINSFLPNDIKVILAQEVCQDFHARFFAYRRAYRYVLSNELYRPCILQGRVGWTFKPLDIEKMHHVAQNLVGEQDFSTFRSSECQAKSPVKTLFSIDIYQDNGMICFDFVASGFLHHMVRNMVGALVEVGVGRINEQQFKDLILARDRTFAPPTFMPDGLYLVQVAYPEKYGVQPARLPEWFWGKSVLL